MNNKQTNKIAMSLAVQGICDANITIWQPLTAFADAYTDAKTRITTIQSLSQSQSQDTSGIAQDKQAARQAMCNLALPVGNAVHAYAVKNKNHELANKVDFSLSDLLAGRDLQSAERCQGIYDTANANVANLTSYGVTAAKLTALQAAITAYKTLISKPRDARATGKTVTGNLQTEFDALDEALAIMDDLVQQFAPANQKFVDDYTNARIIVDVAASHASPTPPPAPASTPKP